MREIDLDTLLTLALHLADAAGEVIRPYFRKPLAIRDKPDLTPVTAADRAAEAAMRALIEARFPDHGIVGEEQRESEKGVEVEHAHRPISAYRDRR